MTQNGLYGKYTIIKADGTPTDADAQYFILLIDTDIHARRALRAYATSLADSKNNGQLEEEIWLWLEDTRNTPAGIEEEKF